MYYRQSCRVIDSIILIAAYNLDSCLYGQAGRPTHTYITWPYTVGVQLYIAASEMPRTRGKQNPLPPGLQPRKKRTVVVDLEQQPSTSHGEPALTVEQLIDQVVARLDSQRQSQAPAPVDQGSGNTAELADSASVGSLRSRSKSRKSRKAAHRQASSSSSPSSSSSSSTSSSSDRSSAKRKSKKQKKRSKKKKSDSGSSDSSSSEDETSSFN